MGLFDFYWILLIVSGILMLGLGASGFGGATKGVRAINVIFGVGFIGYGLYLGLFFTGTSYIIFFKAFIVPVLLVVNAIRNKSARSKAPAPRQPFNQAPASPWAVPNQSSPNQGAPNQGATNQATAAPAPLTAPTLSSDDVLGR
jgi:hypothetical protein